ncbi:HMG1/2-like protein [Humulus lupulus]|uniref:HMG1/2-like protein n=1 Tax=Humulus lupulus TaxID=3486 RepID=UPI002B41188B|nr:HMG1/2-like protein [Humulus lupulus]
MKGAKSTSKRAEPKLSVKKGAAAATKGRKPTKKAAKDPNKPKRPASAFFVFMEDFRKQFNKENPNNKAVSAVGKAAGEKWKSMTEADKAPFVAKAEKRKIEYEKNMKAYNKRQADGPAAEEDGSEKSMSEVNDEEEGDEDGSGEEDDDE